MKTAVCVSGFLLLLFTTGAQLSPEPEHLLEVVGRSVEFSTGYLPHPLDYYLLYRVSTDGDQLLANCSQQEGLKPVDYEVKCTYSYGYYFRMSNLTMSQTGDYRAEGWKGGNVTENRSFRLTVCAKGNEEEGEQVYDDDDAVVCRMDSTLGNSSSLQVYRFDQEFKRFTLVLDTNSSLEPLVEDLKGQLEVDLNTSEVTLAEVTILEERFYCTVWEGAQCQSFKSKRLYLGDKVVFAHVGENITLPCISKETPPLDQYEVFWDTPTGTHKVNMTNQQEGMYRNQTGNYSLFIPSVSQQQQSGFYQCWWTFNTMSRHIIRTIYLYVCPLVSPLDVMFSHGESVLLEYPQQLTFSSVDGIMWYRQKVLEPQVLILDSRKGSASLPEDLRGRVSLRGQMAWEGRLTWRGKLTEGERLTNSPLILYNLTAEDSGLYTWRVYEKVETELQEFICSEGIIRLVYLDPFGVHSLFYRAYASLIGCGLLGLVAAVIWFKLRSRRGEQTSGHLYENVQMAEISG